jgi:hypothetical protein
VVVNVVGRGELGRVGEDLALPQPVSSALESPLSMITPLPEGQH